MPIFCPSCGHNVEFHADSAKGCVIIVFFHERRTDIMTVCFCGFSKEEARAAAMQLAEATASKKK